MKGSSQSSGGPIEWVKLVIAVMATLFFAVALVWICMRAQSASESRGDWKKISTIIAEKRK